jgi:hypothetical protein
VIADEIRNERRRLGLAGICGNDVNAIGRFVKAFAGLVDRFGFAFHLHAKHACDNVTDDGASMTVRRRGLAGAVLDLNHSGLQVFTIQLRQRVRQRDARSFFGFRVLGRVGALSPCQRTSHRSTQNHRHSNTHSGSIHGWILMV